MIRVNWSGYVQKFIEFLNDFWQCLAIESRWVEAVVANIHSTQWPILINFVQKLWVFCPINQIRLQQIITYEWWFLSVQTIKWTLFCTLNCISSFYKENVPDSFSTKLENSDHSAVVTACSSGNSGKQPL